MDKYGQIGPEKGDYDHDVRTIAHALDDGDHAISAILAHRGTRMQTVLASKKHLLVIGGDPLSGQSARERDATEAHLWLFVAVQEHGAYWFRVDTVAHPSYVAEKLDVMAADAETITDFLTRLGAAMGADPQYAQSTVVVVDGG